MTNNSTRSHTACVAYAASMTPPANLMVRIRAAATGDALRLGLLGRRALVGPRVLAFVRLGLDLAAAAVLVVDGRAHCG
jgi:hypothetical protein